MRKKIKTRLKVTPWVPAVTSRVHKLGWGVGLGVGTAVMREPISRETAVVLKGSVFPRPPGWQWIEEAQYKGMIGLEPGT